jgi:transposase
MTPRRATARRTSLEKHHDEVIALLVVGARPVEVAAKYKVERSSVSRFIRKYQAEIEALEADARRSVSDYAIADVRNRIEAMNERWQALRDLKNIRAQDNRYNEPGYETGLLVHKVKSDGDGGWVDEYAVDTGALAELRALENEAAKQLNQLPKAGNPIGLTVENQQGGQIVIVTTEPELGF